MKIKKVGGFIQIGKRLIPHFWGNGLMINNLLNLILIKHAMKKISAKNKLKIIDIGAGNAPFKTLIKTKKNIYKTFDYPTVTKTRYKTKNDYEGDISKDVSFIKEKFGLSLYLDCLEHVPEPHKSIQNISSLLEAKGQIILTTPFLYKSHMQPFNYFHSTKFGLFSLAEKNKMKVDYYSPRGDFFITLLNLLIQPLAQIYSIITIPFILWKPAYKIMQNIFWTITNILLLPIALIYIPYFFILRTIIHNSPKFIKNKIKLIYEGAYAPGHIIILRKK